MYPTMNPTAVTTSPTSDQTAEECSSIYATVTSNQDNGVITSSYPVAYGPLTYRIPSTSIIGYPNNPNPCDIASFNATSVNNKIVLLDGTQNTDFCDYKQWTLNLESFGAKAVLIGVDTEFILLQNYKGIESLSDPNIPTRFIEMTDANGNGYNDMMNAFDQGIDVQVTLDCTENDDSPC